MNQVEQWFSILRRKRMAAPNFKDLADLETKILAFISEWNRLAHPFNWSSASIEKILAKVDDASGRPPETLVTYLRGAVLRADVWASRRRSAPWPAA
jgi:hypothetical protein